MGEEGGEMMEDSSWHGQREWLCPASVPNLTATAVTFQIAKRVFLMGNNKTAPTPQHAIHRFFSNWPGHMTYHDPSTGHRATILRTFKCGSKTLGFYLKDTLAPRNGGSVYKSLRWKDFPNDNAKTGCIVSSFRDPVSHFLSGLGEVESRRRRRKELDYEKLPMPSTQRFLAFLDFLLHGSWLSGPLRHNHNSERKLIGHVFPQSGHLVHLHSIHKNMSGFIDMQNIADETVTTLRDTCGLPGPIPELVKTKKHRKVGGLDDFLKQLWSDANSDVASDEIRRAFESICLLNAVDYACLDSELKEPAPILCQRAFRTHLPVW
jgi:hypothetical protein